MFEKSNTFVSLYKSKVRDILMNTYNGQVNEDFINRYIDKICKPVENVKLKAHVRNLYQYNYHSEIEVNDVLTDIDNGHLNILANGLFTENKLPINYIIINDWMDSRTKYKKKMLEAKSAGDSEKEFYYNNMQNKVKANTNSIYGASTMGSGFISNIDMAGAITSQARNFISEMVWNIERFLGSNFTFENINEIFGWLDMLFKTKAPTVEFNNLMNEYIDYIPTPDDCRHKFIYITKDVKFIRKNMENMNKTCFLMFEMMEDWKRVIFYYANDIISLVGNNPRVAKVVEKLITSNVEFINPYMFEKIKPEFTHDDVLNYFKNDDKLKDIAEDITEFYETLATYRKLIDVFVMNPIIVANRTIKYENRRRKVCVIGDTDSTMPSMTDIVRRTFKVFNREDLMKDDSTKIRMVMVYFTLISDLMDKCCMNFVKSCNQYNEGEKFYMYMKNEFFFPIVLLFNVKKNYIGIQTIQEGKLLPKEKQLAITGRALGSASLNEYVSAETLRIIQDDVLHAEKYNPITVFSDVVKLQNHVKQELRSGNKDFGIYAKFNGADNIKDPETTSNVRASIIWNDLYPEDYISPGDAIYVFDTTLISESDLDKIPDEFNEIKERIRKYVFRPRANGWDFSRFGLKKIAIPAYGDTLSVPEWLTPFISIDPMCEKHLQPLTSLFPSLLLSPCSYVDETSNTKKLGISSLIKF